MLINNDTIIKDDNPIIRQRSNDVDLPLNEEDKSLLMDMYNYVIDSTDEEKAEKNNLRAAVGISAIQVGIPKKMTAIVIKDSEGNITSQYALANPKIVTESLEKAYLLNGEGCLSVPTPKEGLIYRSARIKVKAYDLLQDKNITLKLDGYLAIVFQHELDHFKGKLFYDYINTANPMYKDPNAICIE